MFVLWGALNRRHPTMDLCRRVEENKLQCLVADEERTGDYTESKACSHPLTMVSSLKHPRRVLSASDYDWSEVVVNIHKSWKKWVCLSRILGQDGVDATTVGLFYKEVVQAILLFGSETWFVNPFIGRMLGIFHHRMARRIMGKQPRRGVYSSWRCHPLSEATAEKGIYEVDTYVKRWNKMVAHYILDYPIMDLCLETEWRPGSRVSQKWLIQGRFDLVSEQAVVTRKEGL